MKKFYIEIVSFLVLVLVVFSAIIFLDMKVVGNQYEHSYNAALIDKVELLKSIDEPKIVLVGNSNVCFGMNSEMLEEAFGMPVVNLGLHGGLGNAFHEEIAKQSITEGDIVVICHNNYADENNIPDLELAWITIEKNFELWSIIREEDYSDMLRAYPSYAFDAVTLWLTGLGNRYSTSVYARESFNENGDIVYKPESEAKEVSAMFYEGTVSVPKINDICIERINKYNTYVENCGATLLIAGYPIGDGEYTPEKIEFVNFQKELANRVDCEVISDYTDYFIPYEYFYNSNLHLSKEGAKIRTQQLIDDLSDYGLKYKQ